MPKPLVFRFGGQHVALQMDRVDRGKLYGHKEAEMRDETNAVCDLATLAADGRTVVGRGGTATGYITVEGHWCERGELTPVDLEGKPIEPVGSSFDGPVPLLETVDIDEYLSYEIRAVYSMQMEGPAAKSLFHDQLKQGTIFRFPFSFRGGIEPEEAFLLMNDAEELFMAIGARTGFAFVGLRTAGPSEEEPVDPVFEDMDPLDFEMI